MKYERVQFHEEVWLPGRGDASGVNNSRSLGSDVPINHSIVRVGDNLEVTFLATGQVVDVPWSNVRFAVRELEVKPTKTDLDVTETVNVPVKELVYAPAPAPVEAKFLESEPDPEPTPTPARKGRGKTSAIVVGVDDGSDE